MCKSASLNPVALRSRIQAPPRRGAVEGIVTILADRGFGDVKLFAFLGELGFEYVTRLRGNIRPRQGERERNHQLLPQALDDRTRVS
jgi:hypothetical protein